MVLGSLIIAFALPARKQTQNKAPTTRGFVFSLDVVNVWTLTKINPFISWYYTIFSTLRRRVFLCLPVVISPLLTGTGHRLPAPSVCQPAEPPPVALLPD
ncbi:hypothetical protein D3C77_328550 [compost metagenome]